MASALLATSIVLALTGSRLERWSLPKRADPVKVQAGTGRDTVLSVASFTRNATWRAGMVRALESSLAIGPSWDVPPAGLRLPHAAGMQPGGVLVRQRLALSVHVIDTHQELRDDNLEIKPPLGFAPATDAVKLGEMPSTTFTGVLGNDSRVVLKVTASHWFRAPSTVIDPVLIVIRLGMDTIVTLTHRSSDQTQTVSLAITLLPAARESASVFNLSAGEASTERRVGQRVGADVDSVLVLSKARYTFLIVAADSTQAGRIGVVRTDSMLEVGAYSRDGRILAVATNAHASLLLHAVPLNASDQYTYGVYSASGAGPDVARDLILIFLGDHLGAQRRDGTIPTAEEIERTVRWLLRAFNTTLRRSDVESIANLDPSLAQHRDALLQLTHW